MYNYTYTKALSSLHRGANNQKLLEHFSRYTYIASLKIASRCSCYVDARGGEGSGFRHLPEESVWGNGSFPVRFEHFQVGHFQVFWLYPPHVIILNRRRAISIKIWNELEHEIVLKLLVLWVARQL